MTSEKQSGTTLPRIAVTMGDPAGVGPELCVRLLADAEIVRECVPIIFGDAALLRRVAGKIGGQFAAPIIALHDWPAKSRDVNVPSVLDFQNANADAVQPGKISAACGDAAFRYVVAATEAGMRGEVDTVSTGPLNKEALHAAGQIGRAHV